MTLRSLFYGLFGLWLSTTALADTATPVKETDSNLQKTAEKEPLFKDGKGFYSYKKPLNITLPKDGKVLIQYFYQYGCEVCSHGLDYLKLYAERNKDKVILQYSPSFAKGNAFTGKMHATFSEYGRPELSELYLFDSLDRKDKESLTENNEAIQRWLKRNGIDIAKFYQLFTSVQVEKRMEQDLNVYRQYKPPAFTPIAILNGHYVLLKNTLYNDDYTYAVLDFLVEKLQQEK